MCEVLEILKGLHPEVDFLAHERLIDENVIDSIDIITLVAELNDRLGISIPPEELAPENFNSYPKIKALVERLVAELC